MKILDTQRCLIKEHPAALSQLFGLSASTSKSRSHFMNLPLHDSYIEHIFLNILEGIYDSIAGVGKTGVWLRANFQSCSRVLKKVF